MCLCRWLCQCFGAQNIWLLNIQFGSDILAPQVMNLWLRFKAGNSYLFFFSSVPSQRGDQTEEVGTSKLKALSFSEGVLRMQLEEYHMILILEANF